MLTHHRRQPSRRTGRGFTLIELMIVVAVIAILTAIALPSYRSSVLKSRRADGKTALLDLASRQERYFSVRNKYADKATDLGYSTDFPVPVTSSGQTYYRLWAIPVASPPSFAASAEPINNQATDACGTYTITSLGAQGHSTSVTGCW